MLCMDPEDADQEGIPKSLADETSHQLPRAIANRQHEVVGVSGPDLLLVELSQSGIEFSSHSDWARFNGDWVHSAPSSFRVLRWAVQIQPLIDVHRVDRDH
jgi:hypothetical protein